MIRRNCFNKLADANAPNCATTLNAEGKGSRGGDKNSKTDGQGAADHCSSGAATARFRD
jgi:hypothetical protein